MFTVIATLFFVIALPDISFAWGPAVHIGVSLSILDQLPSYLKILLFANLNEYLYGSLAPDFIVGKSFSSKDKHSHNWQVGFSLLKKAKTNREKAFAYGYLSHLGADAVAHGIIVRNLDEKFKNIRHTYIELIADAAAESSYKELAKRVLSRYNADLDIIFKGKVDSVLFSFSTSKIIFKGMVKVSLGKKQFKKILFNPKIVELFNVDLETIQNYIMLSKNFAADILIKKENSPVIRLSAVSD